VAAAGADIGECIFGSVAERFEAREIEEAAIALHGMDEAEDAIEARAIVGLGFPSHDFAAEGFEHFAALGYEIGNQVVHGASYPHGFGIAYGGEELMRR